MATDRSLTRLEREVLTIAFAMMTRGQIEFYGYDLASHLEDVDGAYRKTGFSTMYRTLDRLEARKLLASRWDLNSNKPRRVYQFTDLGKQFISELKRINIHD